MSLVPAGGSASARTRAPASLPVPAIATAISALFVVFRDDDKDPRRRRRPPVAEKVDLEALRLSSTKTVIKGRARDPREADRVPKGTVTPKRMQALYDEPTARRSRRSARSSSATPGR